MNLKKRMLIKLGILISFLVASAIAATPGSNCRIDGSVNSYTFSIGGIVYKDGKLCTSLGGSRPDFPFKVRATLSNGVQCNIGYYESPFGVTVRAVCNQ
jgi:hypothetical protein